MVRLARLFVDDRNAAEDVVQEAFIRLARLARDADNLAVLECVRRLPIRQRDCITLRYFEERSIDEIAAALGLSVNSVKTHLRRAMEHLGRELATRSHGT